MIWMGRPSILILAMLVVTAPFQNCGRAYSPVLGTASGEKLELTGCDDKLFDAFSKTYHPKLREVGCQTCHSPGLAMADAPFAAGDAITAFSDFKKRGPEKINARVNEGHNQSVLGYDPAQLQPVLAAYLQNWSDVEASCSAKPSTSVSTDKKQSDLFDPNGINDLNKCGIGDPLRADYLNRSTITWSLGSVRPELANVTIRISVKPNIAATIGGLICSHQGYRAGAVTVATDKALHIKNVHMQLNGADYGVNTFLVDRTVPAGSTAFQLIDSTSGGYGIFDSGSSANSDQWSLYIENLEILN